MERAWSNRQEAQEIQQTLEELRASVRRQAGYSSEDEVPAGPVPSAVREAADLARISAHLPLRSNVPVLGPLVVLIQRALRIGLRWYINPIVEQQNAFNDAVVRALTDLEVRQGELRRRIETQSSPADEQRES